MKLLYTLWMNRWQDSLNLFKHTIGLSGQGNCDMVESLNSIMLEVFQYFIAQLFKFKLQIRLVAMVCTIYKARMESKDYINQSAFSWLFANSILTLTWQSQMNLSFVFVSLICFKSHRIFCILHIVDVFHQVCAQAPKIYNA